MAGRLLLLTVGQTSDGQVEATFELLREGRKGLQIRETFEGKATTADVVNQLATRCAKETAVESAPALLLIEKLFEGGIPRSIPDPAPPADEQAS